MRAVMVSRFGGPEVLQVREVPDPVPGEKEVLIDVDVIDTLWLETMVRSGAGQGHWPMRPPYVPGRGVVGRVVQAGAGSGQDLLGRRVVACTSGQGGYADRVVVAAGAVVEVPEARPNRCTCRRAPGPARTVRSSAYIRGGSSASASTHPIATRTNSRGRHAM